jgi:LAO/AO transport system kinase
MLKAGILEIADVFVVNKADLDGADRTVKELREMVHMRDASPLAGHHGAGALDQDRADTDAGGDGGETAREPPIVETVARTGDGVEEFLEALADHSRWLERTGERETQARKRYAAEIRTLLREDGAALVEAELEARGGLDAYVDAVAARETDPYRVAEEVLAPIADCVRDERPE